ncbi:hypothetical protein JCM19233_6598 [Vibrio astriarenae]|nr:hypothetical protein JCM19233_6598 [Vibrio sp. C7]
MTPLRKSRLGQFVLGGFFVADGFIDNDLIFILISIGTLVARSFRNND